MTASPPPKPKRTETVIACVVGGVLFSISVSGWLGDAYLAEQIWPLDINEAVLRSLGGEVQQNVLGESVIRLSAGTVGLRIGLAVLLLLGVTRMVRRRSSATEVVTHTAALSAVRQTAFVFFGSSAWWLLWIIGDIAVPAFQNFAIGCLPLWLTTTLAILAWIWWTNIFHSSDATASSTNDKQGLRVAVLSGCVLGWVAVSFWMNFCLYQQVLIPHGDSAMYEEHLWNVWHGKGFRSYLDQGLFLGEHVQVIHLLLLPFHMLWPSHLLLELSESIALGSCAIPVYLIAKRHTKCTRAAVLLGVAWLFYHPMHFLDIDIEQKTFRPIALGLPFIFWLIEFSERRCLLPAFICLLFALSAKEDMALILCPLMATLAIRTGQTKADNAHGSSDDKLLSQASSRRWLFAGSAFCGIYLVVVVLTVIPAFRSGDHVHYSRYFGDLGGTPGELIKTTITDPVRVISKALGVRTLLYVCVFLAPVAFFPIRKPLLLASGVFTFGMLSLLELGDGSLPPIPYHHFHAPLLPVIFWAAIVAIGHSQPLLISWGSQQRRSMTSSATLMLFCCVATSITGSLMPNGVSFWSNQSPFGYPQLYIPTAPRHRMRPQMAEIVVRQIPLNARVASTDYIHTRLTHCERSYDYSDYLRAVNNYQPGVPIDTDFIVVDTGHRYSKVKVAADIRELKQAPDEWELLPDETDGMFIVLKRRAGKDP